MLLLILLLSFCLACMAKFNLRFYPAGNDPYLSGLLSVCCRLSAVEGQAMDPQNRILLEQSFAALSEAQSQTGSLVETRTGVYVGCMYQEFTQLQYNLGYGISPAIATGNGISYLVGRVSYAFGLQGPCVSTDTACSSSLVAVDLAHKVILYTTLLARNFNTHVDLSTFYLQINTWMTLTHASSK